jgi:hypothetical protein
MYKAGATATTTGSYSLIWSGFFTVVPNGRYEAFGYLLTLQCDADMRVQWYTAAGDLVAGADAVLLPTPVPRYTGDTTTIECWQRQRVQCFATAPATAAVARFTIQVSKADAGQTSATVALARPYFGRAGTSQTEYSKWYPNYQGPITENSRSTYIRDAAIDTAAIKDLAVDTLKIAGHAVTVTSFTTTQLGLGLGSTFVITPEAWTDLIVPEKTVTLSGLPTGEVAGTIFTVNTGIYGVIDDPNWQLVDVSIFLKLAATLAVPNPAWQLLANVADLVPNLIAALTGYYELPNGTHTVRVQAKVRSDGSGATPGPITIEQANTTLTITSGKR